MKRLDSALHFEAKNEGGSTIQLDGSGKTGGVYKAPGPMQAVLMAMGGCSGIDVVLILNKQKQEIKNFEIIIDGEREEGKELSLWKTVHAHFILSGTIEKEKAERAVKLSIEKYCSVAETLRRAGATITHSVSVNA